MKLHFQDQRMKRKWHFKIYIIKEKKAKNGANLKVAKIGL